MIERILMGQIDTTKSSILLLGPRQIGKTTLLKATKPDLTINFSSEREFQEHLNQPGLIEDLIERQKPKLVFIDEVQRIPSILNTVQSIIDNKKIRFLITGSSARKLKRGQANLLPGRVINKKLFPLTISELNYDYETPRAISWGFLPGIVTCEKDQDRQEILSSYVSNYLKEEVQQEALTRNLAGYSRFLSLLPEYSGKVLDYSKLATKNKLNRFAVHRFFEIYEDTLLGQRVYAYEGFEGQKIVRHPKFYFFDSGVMNGILNHFRPMSDYLGVVCETIVFNQLDAMMFYRNQPYKISYFRNHSGYEVDFMLERSSETLAIEVKSNDNLSEDDISSLEYVKNLNPKIKPYLLHFGKKSFKIKKIWCLPWVEGLKELCS